MTQSTGFVRDPPGCDPPLSTIAPSKWPVLPQAAHDDLRNNTVYVEDPKRILVVRQAQRWEGCQLLVKRFTSQLLNGCREPACTTPTCFSFRKRISQGPVRRLTSISARTIACHLAMQENPQKHLCPHQPIVFRTESNANVQGNGNKPTSADFTYTPFTLHSTETNSLMERARRQFDESRRGIKQVDEALAGRPDGKIESEQSKYGTQKKDPRSLTQNLFDTSALRSLDFVASPTSNDLNSGLPNEGEVTAPGRLVPDSDEAMQSIRQHPNMKTNPILPNARSRTASSSMAEAEPPVCSKQPCITPAQPQPVASSTLGSRTRCRTRHSIPLLNKQEQLPKRSIPRRRRHSLEPTRSPAPLSSATMPRKSNLPNSDTVSVLRDPFETDKVNHKEALSILDSSSMERDMNTYSGNMQSVAYARGVSTHLADPNDSHMGCMDDMIGTPGPNPRKRPQTLTHLSFHLVILLRQKMESPDVLSRVDRETLNNFMSKMRSCSILTGGTEKISYEEWHGFVQQSIFYTLGDPFALLESFKEPRTPSHQEDDPFKVEIDPQKTDEALRWLIKRNSEVVFDSLWQSLEALFVPPPELSPPRNSASKLAFSKSRTGHARTPGRNTSCSTECKRVYFSDAEACHIILICIHALVAALPETWAGMGWLIQLNRGLGRIGPGLMKSDPRNALPMDYAIRRVEVFENEMYQRLACRLVRAIAARVYYAELMKTTSTNPESTSLGDEEGFLAMLCDHLRKCSLQGYLGERSFRESGLPPHSGEPSGRRALGPYPMPEILIEWVRTVMLKNWDNRPEMPRFSLMGSAVVVMRCFYERRKTLALSAKVFHTPYFFDRLDAIDMPVEWLSSSISPVSLHLLSFPFLFPPLCLVKYFRALNYSSMSRAHEGALSTKRLLLNLAMLDPADKAEDRVDHRLRTAITPYLVLDVRRDNLLATTFNQLWRREKRELLRPLKVKMGMEEGEEGTDIGGVQQEFFRMAVIEALNPDYGLFATDPETRLTWFQPRSFEALWKYELIGVLASLAVYNGAIAPFAFPKAFYRKLLGLPVTEIDHIRDGWPALSKGLDDLLSWNDGDVKDVFLRTYEYSFDAFGSVVTVDMQRVGREDAWPDEPDKLAKTRGKGKPRLRFGSPDGHSIVDDDKDGQDDVNSELRSRTPLKSESPKPPHHQSCPETPPPEPALVTNENRCQYVKDYIFWLTDKSIRPQFEAFAQGFYTCLDRKAVGMFDSTTLQTVVEGSQEVDFNALQDSVRYDDGYSAEHRVIKDFWSIVHDYSQERKRQLLEFVTASDRVPVNGIRSILFVIQRSGGDSERLPTTLTCFGRLLLPEYSSKKKLKQKLQIALENGKGFGVP